MTTDILQNDDVLPLRKDGRDPCLFHVDTMDMMFFEISTFSNMNGRIDDYNK
jgi:hypothetical protein